MKRILFPLFNGGAYTRGLLEAIVRSVAEKPDWNLHLAQATPATLPALLDLGVDGIIVQCASREIATIMRRAACPVVNVDGSFSGLPFTQVTSEAHATGHLAGSHFRDQRFQRAAFIGEEGRSNVLAQHLGLGAGFGQECPRFLVPLGWRSGDDAQSGSRFAVETLERWLLALPRPCGVLAWGEMLVHDLISILVRLGQAGDGLHLMASNDDPLLFPHLRPPISAVTIDTDRTGRAAVAALGRLIAGGTVPKQIEIPPLGIQVRASTDIVLLDDPLAAQAMRHLRDRIGHRLTAEGISRSLGVSKRTLERRFSQAVGHGVAEEIRRRRLAQAAELLRWTDLSLKQVARRCGFPSSAHFGLTFRKWQSVTPGAYRRQHQSTGRIS